MQLFRTSSSSSTEPGTPALGTELAGFRLERMIGRGSASVVYEATQISLDRRVALKLFPGGSPRSGGQLEWPEHPNVVSLYAAGPSEHGYFVAMQLVRGRNLAQLLDTRRPTPADLLSVVSDVAAALDSAHRSGIVHGAVGPRSVMVDEEDWHGLLSDFGLGSADATRESDLFAFAALVHDCFGRKVRALEGEPSSAEAIVQVAQGALPAPGPARRPRRRTALVGAAVAAALAAGATVAVLAGSGGHPQRTTPPLDGLVAIGSALPATGVASVDCGGRPRSGASEPCTVVQTKLGGHPLAAPSNGVIRKWAVRGAQGELALQVLRKRKQRIYLVARTEYSLIRDKGPHVLPANLPVRKGDLVGVAVAPGAAIGVRRASGATTRRRFGPADVSAGRFDRSAGMGLGQELLLRAEYIPGARWRPAGLVTGQAAARATGGRQLDVLELQGNLSVVAVNALGRIEVDLFAGTRRIARLPLTGASQSGRLASLYTLRLRFGRPIVRVVWRNPDGLVSHDYTAGERSLVPLD